VIVILGFDALDLSLVKKFDCKELMQLEFGQTDVSNFNFQKTVVLWASFLTGKNMENVVKGDLWSFKLPQDQTLFSMFDRFSAIDIPAFTYKQDNHARERKLLAGFFNEKNTIEEYDAVVWKNHMENKSDFFDDLKAESEIAMGYFDIADSIGHLSFGIEGKIREVYEELDGIAEFVRKNHKATVLIISDHGMKAVGRFGDHTKNGFYSFNKKVGLKLPKITEFRNIILGFK
jgi:hypothetical protein